MQKQVSKQSLAIVALSILLAISMALTATFAAFNVSSTATGTITFNGTITTVIAPGTDGFSFTATENNEVEFQVSISNQADLDALTGKIGAITIAVNGGNQSAPVYYGVKVTATSDASVPVTIAEADSIASGYAYNGNVACKGSFNNDEWTLTDTDADVSAVALSSLFKFTLVDGNISAGETLTITVKLAASTTASEVATALGITLAD